MLLGNSVISNSYCSQTTQHHHQGSISSSTLTHELITRHIDNFCWIFSNCKNCKNIHTKIMNISVGAQSTLGGRHFCPKIYAWKINKMPEFYMIFPDFFWRGNCPLPPSPTPMIMNKMNYNHYVWYFNDLYVCRSRGLSLQPIINSAHDYAVQSIYQVVHKKLAAKFRNL